MKETSSLPPPRMPEGAMWRVFMSCQNLTPAQAKRVRSVGRTLGYTPDGTADILNRASLRYPLGPQESHLLAECGRAVLCETLCRA